MKTLHKAPRGQQHWSARPQHIFIAGLMTAFLAGAVQAGSAHAGSADVLNGGRLTVDGVTHMLYGITAPALGEQCQLRGKSRDCGVLARAGLKDLTAGANVICKPSKAAPDASKCLSDGYDLSEGMVYTGWAVPLPAAPQRLHMLLKRAKTKRHGMWHE